MSKMAFSGEYSMNNIPIPPRKEYKSKLIRKTEKFISRIRWKYFWATIDKRKDAKLGNHPQARVEIEGKNMYGFRTPYAPPRFEKLKPFETGHIKIHAIWSYKKRSYKKL